MAVSFDQRLAVLRAVAEATRLRIVALLIHGELSVSELTDILGQSQPRVSRHLKVLADADIVASHREGNYVFFANTDTGRSIAGAAVASIDDADGVLSGDRARLDEVRAERARVATEYFARVAGEWDELRSRHAPEVEVEAEILAVTADLDYSSVLDLGTGTGRMLGLLVPGRRLTRAVGVDSSPAMLSVARSNLADVTFENATTGAVGTVELRQGDLHTTSFATATFDLVVIHQVLHYLDDAQRAVRHAAELVRPGGHLLIVDVAPHQLDMLQSDHAHRKLGFEPAVVTGWMEAAGIDQITRTQVDHTDGPDDDTDDESLTVVIWRGQRHNGGGNAAVARSDIGAHTSPISVEGTTIGKESVHGHL